MEARNLRPAPPNIYSKDVTLQRSGSVGRATRAWFGKLPDGRAVEAITLRNCRGVAVTVMTYGATLQSAIVPNRYGTLAEVALGYSQLQPYLENRHYLGATIGRYANRIGGGAFELGNRVHRVDQNEGYNALHGGVAGFDKQVWDFVQMEECSNPSIVLRHVSPMVTWAFRGN